MILEIQFTSKTYLTWFSFGVAKSVANFNTYNISHFFLCSPDSNNLHSVCKACKVKLLCFQWIQSKACVATSALLSDFIQSSYH